LLSEVTEGVGHWRRFGFWFWFRLERRLSGPLGLGHVLGAEEGVRERRK
jgi:hypothetical protein